MDFEQELNVNFFEEAQERLGALELENLKLIASLKTANSEKQALRQKVTELTDKLNRLQTNKSSDDKPDKMKGKGEKC